MTDARCQRPGTAREVPSREGDDPTPVANGALRASYGLVLERSAEIRPLRTLIGPTTPPTARLLSTITGLLAAKTSNTICIGDHRGPEVAPRSWRTGGPIWLASDTGERSCLSLVWAVLDRASRGWRGVDMNPRAVRRLQDLRRELFGPPVSEEGREVMDESVVPAA